MSSEPQTKALQLPCRQNMHRKVTNWKLQHIIVATCFLGDQHANIFEIVSHSQRFGISSWFVEQVEQKVQDKQCAHCINGQAPSPAQQMQMITLDYIIETTSSCQIMSNIVRPWFIKDNFVLGKLASLLSFFTCKSSLDKCCPSQHCSWSSFNILYFCFFSPKARRLS